MSKRIKVGIIGYGNLGRGVEAALKQQPDMELVGIFSRRGKNIKVLDSNVETYHVNEAIDFKDKIDVMILCGGSATDLPIQTPEFTEHFNTIDSFDTHARIPEHFSLVDSVAQKSNKVSIISVGWDPGLFSINRVLGDAVLQDGKTYTFWGKGVSQGHSDAIRRVEGVKAGVQYTIPSKEAMEEVRKGKQPELSASQMHVRECFVVAEEGYDKSVIEKNIKTMPNYFADYKTTVHFISEEELNRDHVGMPHGGFVMRSGITGEGNHEMIEFGLTLESNPEFTASVLVAYARAAYRLNSAGDKGCKTVYDIPLSAISPLSNEELRQRYL